MSVKATPSRAEQARQTRQQILDTAIELFADRGFDATSLQLIADRMGVTKAAVYYYFPAKADILKAISAPAMDAMIELIAQAATKRGRSTRIEFIVTGFVDVLLSQRNVITIFASDPAVRENKHLDAGRYDQLIQRAVEVVFGDDPTSDERAALYLASGLGDMVPYLKDLPNEELRAVLIRTGRRLLQVPAPR